MRNGSRIVRRNPCRASRTLQTNGVSHVRTSRPYVQFTVSEASPPRVPTAVDIHNGVRSRAPTALLPRTTGVSSALQEDYDHLGLQLARRNVDIEALTERAARIPRGGALMGRGYRRYPLCPFSRTGRAAQRLREARGLRGRLQARSIDARNLAAHSRGTVPNPPPAFARSQSREGSSSSR